MAEFLPVSFTDSSVAMPQDLMAALRQDMENDFEGLANGNFRRIKPRKMDFVLYDNGTQTVVPANELYGVLVRAHPKMHCVWYERNYAPGQEPESPDLVWVQNEPDQFPDALPEKYRHKIIKDGRESWAFQICRRTIWVLFRKTPQGASIDINTPYVLDLTSMSMFGKGQPDQNTYKFGGLRNFCQTYTSQDFVLSPIMFPTQITLDANVSVSGVLNFRPMLTPQGHPCILNLDAIKQLRSLRDSDTVKSLLEIREKLDYKPNGGNPTVTTVQPAQPVQPVQQAPKATLDAGLLAQAQSVINSAQATGGSESGTLNDLMSQLL
jgi:hypothetical protein